MEKTIEIPEGYEARIEGNKVILEPKESEDERIRKTLLRCCDDWEKGQFGCMAKEDIPAIRAYLEKQKEVQPGDKDRYMEGYMNGMNDALKGAEPIEWSEEDEKELDGIISILDNLGFEEFCKSSRDQDVEEERLYYKEIQCLKRLESLCDNYKNCNCRWKPSREQLLALKEQTSWLSKPNPLHSLYHQLCEL